VLWLRSTAVGWRNGKEGKEGNLGKRVRSCGLGLAERELAILNSTEKKNGATRGGCVSEMVRVMVVTGSMPVFFVFLFVEPVGVRTAG
jgi:hypothetical protein